MSFDQLEGKKAALVHGYWPSQLGNGPYTQGLRGDLITRLSAAEFHSGRIEVLMTANGSVWGEQYQPPGRLMADDWEHKYGVPRERIVCRPEAVSTFDENRLFVEEVQSRGWTDLTDIAFGKHHWVIPHYYPAGIQINYRSAEQLAKTVGNLEDQALMRWLHFSSFELTYAGYLAIQKAILLAGQGEFLRRLGSSTRTGKRKEFIFPTDKFDL